MEGKNEVRELASSLGLRVASKRDSQEICFVPDNDYRQFLTAYRPGAQRPGPIINTAGVRFGTHAGLAGYTIGQRKGLGIAASEPLYVVDIDVATNTLVVGGQEHCFRQELIADDVNWVSRDAITQPLDVTVRIRYRVQPAPAQIMRLEDGRVLTVFKQPQRAITPGQSVVWYDGDMVIGGGTIIRHTAHRKE